MKGIQFCSNEGPRTFPRGDNYEIAKIHWQIFKIFFSRTTGPIWTNLGTNHPCVKGILDNSNEGPLLFPKRDDYDIVKICTWHLILNVFSVEPLDKQIMVNLICDGDLIDSFKFDSQILINWYFKQTSASFILMNYSFNMFYLIKLIGNTWLYKISGLNTITRIHNFLFDGISIIDFIFVLCVLGSIIKSLQY